MNAGTYITKLQDTYFLVDCYHDEIIYSDSLDRELNEWEVMTDEINRGHTTISFMMKQAVIFTRSAP